MKEIAKGLLEIGAVALSAEKPFTWASGIKSPIYCDNRLTLSYPEVRKIIEEEMIRVIKEEFPDTEMIMGTATAGIPHAAICAWELELPMGFVRGKAKDHGKENRIEGKVTEGMKTVVIEDLISTGGSSLEAVRHLREQGADVTGLISIFTYEMEKAQKAVKEENVKTISLTDLSELLEVAEENKFIKPEDQEKIRRFIINPSDESWMK